MSDINIVLENRDDIHVAVEEKDINVEVPAGKDGRSLRPRGEWSAAAAYAYLDLVSYQGSSYVATKAVPAGTLPTNTSYWMLSAEKGEPGGAVWGNISGDLSDQTDLQEALDDKAPVIISSASGSIASFTDGSASPVTALTVSIEPVQSGTGDPSPTNVRPISGHTSAVVTRTGKNLFDYSARLPNYYLDVNTGQPVAQSGYFVTPYIPVQAGKPIVFLESGSGRRWLYDIYKNPVTYLNNSSNQVYTPPIDGFVRITISGTSSRWDTYQIEYGTAPTDYEEYRGTSVTIDLDGTRYGGTLDVLTGMMVVDRVKYTFAASDLDYIDHKAYSSAIRNNFGYTTNFPIEQCDCFAIGTYSDMTGSTPTICVANQGYVYIGWDNFDNIIGSNRTQIRTYFSDNPVSIVFPLATPITVQLSPSQLSTLLGQNNIFADTGDVAVEYRADTKRYIDSKFSQLQALILEN